MPMRNFYSILGVPQDADQPTIRRAYRGLVFAHPDTGESPDPARFRGIQEAYSVLSDERQRRAYDREFRPRRRAASRFSVGFRLSLSTFLVSLLRRPHRFQNSLIMSRRISSAFIERALDHSAILALRSF